MNGKKRKVSEYLRPLDLFMVIIFLLIAAFSTNMFWYDFLRTLNMQNVEPVGTVIIKKNTVQRRLADRVLWDRLIKESPVYIGDLIRVAEISAATLYIEDNCIDLDENTLIRITRAEDGKTLQIVLGEGNISIAAGIEGVSLTLDFNGMQIHARPGTVLSAASGKTGGIYVQVNDGNARLTEKNGVTREITSGSSVMVDADGTEKQARTAVVTRPLPNTRYVKPNKEPMTVNFLWNRINLAPGERVRLEIASDRNFSRISGVINNLDNQAQAQFGAGFWYWRLLFDNTVLTTGRLTVADGSGPELQSPAFNSLFRYRDDTPALNFQWAEVPEAVSYIVEVSNIADFSGPKIRRQTSVVSMTVAAPAEGSWFWRVMPVFPSFFSGNAGFSRASFFRIEQIPAAVETAGEVSLSRWLAAATPSRELPPDLPPEIIPPHLIKPPEALPPQPAPLPIPLLPAPQNLRPVRGTSFGLQDFRSQRSIEFTWSPVQGANAYILTLYQQATAGRRRIFHVTINNDAMYSFTNLRILDKGTFIWQLEAVNIERANVTGRHGVPGESMFIIDFPSSAPLQIENEGILYGN